MTLKQALLSTMRMHLRLRGQDPKPKDRDVTWTGLTDDEATQIANSALRAVCTLRAVVGVGMDPATIEQRLRTGRPRGTSGGGVGGRWRAWFRGGDRRGNV